ncbi:MAG: FeS-binding protein [Pseudomonadota bacterium]
MSAKSLPSGVSPWFGRGFALVLFFSALTGFAQMPIFKRYYIADIPGLGWLANYTATFTLHHVSAALFLLLAAFALTDHLLQGRGRYRLTTAGAVKAGLLAAIAATGGLLVLRNLPGYRFSPNTVIVMDMGHLGLVMAFLITAAVTALIGKRTVEAGSPQRIADSDR